MKGRPKTLEVEKILILGDQQSPDINRKALTIAYEFMADFKPDKLILIGDFVNFTKISSYTSTNYHVSLKDEIETGKELLIEHISIARKANPNVEITWLFGNHEDRLANYLARNSEQLEDLEVDGELVNSIAHLFQLKKLNVNWQPYKTKLVIHGVGYEHGSFVSTKAGQTATKHMETRGRSVVHGHTHRLALVFRRIGDDQQFGLENGCLCSLNPSPNYSFEPNWINGMSVITYDKQSKINYPQLIPILNNMAMYGNKIYRA